MTDLNVVVVAEDTRVIEAIEFYADSLEFKTHVKSFDNGVAALSYAKNHDVDVFFVDLNLSHPNSYVVAAHLRATPRNKNAMILVLAQHELSPILRDQLPNDVVVMHKPCSPEMVQSFFLYEYRQKVS